MGVWRCVVLGLLLLGAAARGQELPAGVARGAVTVSGLSSGAFMAVQFQVAFSRHVSGVGAVAGGPYLCAEGSLSLALQRCMEAVLPFGAPDAAYLLRRAGVLAAFGHIDPVEGLARARVFVFGGTRDETVRRPVVESLAAFYRAAGVAEAGLVERLDVPAGHGFVVDGPDAGPAPNCGVTAAPFIVDCDYDLAGAVLHHLLAAEGRRVAAPAGRLVAFDQGAFLHGPERHGMDAVGYAYVPPGCEAAGADSPETGCRLHVVFHGCQQGRERLGTLFVTGTGYLEWADSYRLVVVFPQAASVPVSNPLGCWDWWGYDDPDYATNAGRQMRAVWGMVGRVGATQPHSPPGSPELAR